MTGAAQDAAPAIAAMTSARSAARCEPRDRARPEPVAVVGFNCYFFSSGFLGGTSGLGRSLGFLPDSSLTAFSASCWLIRVTLLIRTGSTGTSFISSSGLDRLLRVLVWTDLIVS